MKKRGEVACLFSGKFERGSIHRTTPSSQLRLCLKACQEYPTEPRRRLVLGFLLIELKGYRETIREQRINRARAEARN